MTNIEQLKRAHGAVYEIEVAPEEGSEETLVFMFKKPDRKILAASARYGTTDPVRGAEIMIEACMVHGEMALLDDVAVFQAVSEKFGEINKPREATLKKL